MKSFLHSLKTISQRSLMICAMLWGGYGLVSAQVNCEELTLACNDLVYISLDENCQQEITPDVLLEAPAYEDDVYTVTVMHNNQVIENNIVTSAHIGLTLEVSIGVAECGISCWGNAIIEDKLAPVITGCDDATIKCYQSSSVGSPGISTPIATDACEGILSMTHTDQSQFFMCDGPYGEIITRTWNVSDSHGNSSSCVQTIYVERATLADVVEPPHYDGLPGNQAMFSCTDQFQKLENGAPHPDVTGRPISQACNTINQYFSDLEFEICGASKKYIRNWIVIDWCIGEEETFNQIIKIADDIKPVCLDNPLDTILTTTDSEQCTADFLVPTPSVSDCSSWTYTVARVLDNSPFPSTDGITWNGSNYVISGLAIGSTTIEYKITDDCGNVSKCYRTVVVEDKETPTAICLSYTVVSINETGEAELYASAINDHSHDNCGIDTILIKRITDNCSTPGNLVFGEKVKFCCGDINGSYQQVVLRVIDIYGNFNDCVANVKVEDKLAPHIVCPPATVYVNCTESTHPDHTGHATATDNCSVDVAYKDTEYLNNCGIGYIRRVWTATDVSGRKTTCLQNIYIQKDTPFSGDHIMWPTDQNITGCSVTDLSPETLNSQPSYSNTDCTSLGSSYTDQVYRNLDGYCFKVLRKWKVINWCDANGTPETYTHEQTIAVSNSHAPQFSSGCELLSTETVDNECDAAVTLSAAASDDCTPVTDLVWKYHIDLNKNGKIDITGNTNTYSGRLPAGSHTIEWEVVDDCGNYNACKKQIRIKDTKAPTPVCLGTVVWALDDEGKAEVWASDFDKQSYDACGDKNLKFSFDEQGQHSELKFDCTDIPNGIYMEIPLRVYVTDSYGNVDYCDVILRLQDSHQNDACQDNNSGRPVVSGKLLDHDLIGLPHMEIRLRDMKAESDIMKKSESDGAYAVEAEYYKKYSVQAVKNDDTKNGVNTRDLISIQRHLLGIEKLDNPYKIIAADVDNSKSVNPKDLLEIRKVILGISSSFEHGMSWKFIDAKTEFPNVLRPFNYDMYVEIDEVYTDIKDINLIGVKLGDVNNSAARNLRNEQEPEVRTTVSLHTDDTMYKQGEQVSIPIYASDFRQILGLQLQLEAVPSLSIETVQSGQLSLDKYNFSSNGRSMVLSWNDAKPMEINASEPLFTILATAKNAGSIADAITLSSEFLTSEVYVDAVQTDNVELHVRTDSEEAYAANVLFQNVPNPCSEETTISYQLDQEMEILLSIYDVKGRHIQALKLAGKKGINYYTLDLEGWEAGIYYYSIKGNDYFHTKRMIVVQ